MRQIRAGRVGPGLFGAYVDLMVAAVDERMDHIQGLLDEILANPQAVTAALRMVTLDDAELGPGQADRCRRRLRDDIDVELAPVPVAARGRPPWPCSRSARPRSSASFPPFWARSSWSRRRTAATRSASAAPRPSRSGARSR
jgi:hypothetical protein